MLTTAVVGAGPAGLLFSLIGKILMGDAWKVHIFDKRESYLRTHRLRMAPEPYRAIQEDLHDARFDSLMAFLAERHFSPEVNLLEAKLAELLADLRVERTVRDVTTLDDVEADTVVGADSVHSTVRELVRAGVQAQRRTHEHVARLRVVGPDLPTRLNVVDQFRLSKVLGSVVDYRLNANGFAEVDLFLTEQEHARARALGASPKEPVAITARALGKLNAPLMRAVVLHLERGGREVFVQSTFQLEHTVMPQVSFRVGPKRVFLLGDAAVSLPFFRGMACLASCAHALAHAHASGKFEDYEAQVKRIVRREVAIVRSRAQLVRGLRELIRLSSLLPFPIQSWWLRAARPSVPDKVSPSAYFNLLVAVSALGLVTLGLVSPPLVLLSLPLQIGGGVVYRWTLDLEPGPHRYVRRIWELQIALIVVLGAAFVVVRGVSALAALWWWILGAAFALGIYLFEWLVARRLVRAGIDQGA